MSLSTSFMDICYSLEKIVDSCDEVSVIMTGLHRKGNKGNPSEEIPSLEARKEYIDRLYKDKYDMLLN